MLLLTYNIPERKRYPRITIPERKNIQLKVTERAGDTTGATSARCYTNTSIVNRPVLNFSRTDGTVPRPVRPILTQRGRHDNRGPRKHRSRRTESDIVFYMA